MSGALQDGPAGTRLSLIVVVYNAFEATERCLASVFEKTADSKEVIVVDNASPQNGFERLASRFPEARFIRNQANRGFAAAVNQAAALSSGRHFFLLNPDSYLINDAPRILADWLDEHPRAGLAGPRLINPDGSLQTSTYAFPTLLQSAAHLFRIKSLLPIERLRGRTPAWLAGRIGQFSAHDRAQTVNYCTGAALMVRRDLFERLGGLDERFFLYYEEKDFSLRAWQAGFETWLIPDALVGHSIGASSETAGELPVLARYRSMLAYFAKHHPGRLAWLRGLLGAGAIWRHGLSTLGARREEARLWRKVYRLSQKRDS